MNTVSYQEAVRSFEISCLSKGLSPRTLQTYGDAIEKLRHFMGRRPGDGERMPIQGDLRAFLIHMMDSGLSQASIGIHARSLKAFFGFLHRDGLLASNPMERIPIPRSARTAPVALNASQIGKLAGGGIRS